MVVRGAQVHLDGVLHKHLPSFCLSLREDSAETLSRQRIVGHVFCAVRVMSVKVGDWFSHRHALA
jgi:hypothetical protein